MLKREYLEPKDLMIERNTHICCENRNFVKNFKYLFDENHPLIFNSETYTFDITNEIEVIEKIKMFVEAIGTYSSQ